jgi:hypothetical protein
MSNQPVVLQPKESGMAQASFLLGIVGVVGLVVPPGLPLAPVSGVLAIVFGALARAEARRDGSDARKAVVGIALGAVALLVSATLLFLLRHVLFHVWREISFGPR